MINQEQAIEIARQRAEEKGWGFIEPLNVIIRRSWFGRIPMRFEIETNAHNLGAKARFTVDAETGEIISEGYIPR